MLLFSPRRCALALWVAGSLAASVSAQDVPGSQTPQLLQQALQSALANHPHPAAGAPYAPQVMGIECRATHK